MTSPIEPPSRVAHLLRWGGWWAVLACVLLRCVVAADHFPYWGLDPGRTVLPITGLTPAASLSIDTVILLACGVALLGEVLAGAAILWMPLLLWALGCIGAGVHAFAIRAGTIDDARLAATWCAAMGGGLTAMHLCRDPRVRRVTLAALFGLIAMLAAKGAVQVYHEHPMTLARYNRDRAAFLQDQGWTDGSAAARNFERRLQQPEATGWFGLSNAYATFAASCFAALVGCTVLAWREARHTRQIPDGFAGLLSVGAVAALGALLLAGSKGGFAAAGIGLTLLAGMAVPERLRSRVPARLAGYLTIAMLALVLAAVVVRGLLGEQLGERSLLFRWFYMQGAAKAFVENPLFGTGPDGFKDAYMRLKPPISPEEVSSPHSVLFDFAARLGVFGMLWAGLWLRWVIGLGAAIARPPDSTSSSGNARLEGWLILFAAAAPSLISAWMERAMGTPQQALAKLGGLAGWVGVSIAILVLLRASRIAPAVLAIAALVAAIHGQIEVTPLWDSSAAWICLVLGSAGALSGRTTIREGSTDRPIARAAFAPTLLIGAAVATAWMGVAPASRWELALGDAASAMKPMAEVRTALAEDNPPGGIGPLLSELSRLTSLPIPTNEGELNRSLTTLSYLATAAATPHLEHAATLAPRHLQTREALVRVLMEQAAAAEALGRDAEVTAATSSALAQAKDLVRRHPTASAWGLLGNVQHALWNLTQDPAHLDLAVEAWESGSKLDPHGVSLPLQAFKALDRAGRPSRELAQRLLKLDDLQRLDRIEHLSPTDRAAVERAAATP